MAPVLAPILVFIGALTGSVALLPGDGYQTYLPWFRHTSTAWRHLTLPGWNPGAFAGSPLLAVSQAGAYYPPNLVFVFLPPVVAANLVVVASFIIAGLGAFVLAWHLTGDETAAAVAGVSFGLCGFMFAHVGHTSMIASAAWLPWVLWGYDRLRERITAGRILIASGGLALSFYAGHSQLAFTIVMAVSMYAAVTTALLPRETRGRPILAALLLMIAAVGLSAAQLLPTARYVPYSNRGGGSYTEAMTYSLPASHTPLLLFPYLYGNQVPDGPFASYAGRWNLTELSGYPGMAVLALGAAGIGAARKDRRLLALLVTAASAGALALGPETPVSRLVFHLPVYGQFRAWARYVVVVDLAIAIAGAYGVRRLRQSSLEERWRAIVAAGGAVLTMFVASIVLPALPPVAKYLPHGVRPAAVLLPLSAAVLGLVCALRLARATRWAAALVVVVVAIDVPMCFGWFAEWRGFAIRPKQIMAQIGSHQTFWGGVDDRQGGLDRYLFIGGDIAPMRSDFVGATDLKGLLSANGSGPLAPADYLEALGMSAFGGIGDPGRIWQSEGRALDLLRVTTVIVDTSSAGATPPVPSSLGEGRPIAGTSLVRYERDPALPEAFLVGRAEVRSRPAVLSGLHGNAPFDPGAVALLEEPCRKCPIGGPPGPAGSVRHLSRSLGSIGVEVDASRPAILVLSEAWLPGWSATVHGRKQRTVRVDGLVQGLPVPAGRSRVVLRYRPPGAWMGLAVSSATALALLTSAGMARRWRRAPGQPPKVRNQSLSVRVR
jgi:hypothetical protein